MLRWLILGIFVLCPLGAWTAPSDSQSQSQFQAQGQSLSNNNVNNITSDLNFKSNISANSGALSKSRSSSGAFNGGNSVFEGSTYFPAIPQKPDHSKEHAPIGHLDWDAYYGQLTRFGK